MEILSVIQGKSSVCRNCGTNITLYIIKHHNEKSGRFYWVHNENNSIYCEPPKVAQP